MTTHLTLEQLGDFHDGRLAASVRRDVVAHTAVCTDCATHLAGLDALRACAIAAPRDIAPPVALWPAIRAEIAAGAGNAKVDRAASATGLPQLRRWRTPALIAAGLLIAVASSAATVSLLARRGATGGGDRVPALAGGDRAPAMAKLPDERAAAPDANRNALVRYVALERDYDRTAAALRAELDVHRTTLSPATVATVERSLRTIDGAIAEARAALARDPGNDALVDMLTATHEQRLDLLRRAARIQQEA